MHPKMFHWIDFIFIIVQFSTLTFESVATNVLIAPKTDPLWQRSKFHDPCTSAPCLNAGTCVVTSYQTQSYTCQCLPAYTGDTCAKGRDECAGNPCRNGACMDFIGSFRCHCYPGFTGLLCDVDIDECQSSPCQNAGVCQQTLPSQYACVCPRGFRGFRCETDIDECVALSPCRNGGVCRQGAPGTYTCNCLPGFTGHDCEYKIPQCNSNPCQNDGLCLEGDGIRSFRCSCISGFTGHFCESQVNACTKNTSLCGRGYCQPTRGNGYRCQCPGGVVTESSCDAQFDPCKSSPCYNGGRCRQEPLGSYRCVCELGFEGPTCQTRSRPCDQTADRCQNGGFCFLELNGQMTCSCPANYTGLLCETPSDQCVNGSNPCLNNGTCMLNETEYIVQCQCQDGFYGDVCQFLDFNFTIPNDRGFAFYSSNLDPTLLFAILAIIGILTVLVGVPMIFLYFGKREKPQDFCLSIPRPRYRRLRPASTYTTWIVSSDVNFDRDFSTDVANTPPMRSFYQSTSPKRF